MRKRGREKGRIRIKRGKGEMGENEKCKKTRTTIYKSVEHAKLYPYLHGS